MNRQNKSKRGFTFGPRLRFSVGSIDRASPLEVLRRRVRLLLEVLLLLLGQVRGQVGEPELSNELTVSTLGDIEVVHVQEAVLRGQQHPQRLLDPRARKDIIRKLNRLQVTGDPFVWAQYDWPIVVNTADRTNR